MRTIKLKWYSDPEHAWLRISRRDADFLGILPQITSYSYQSKHGNILYLEEDQDAALVLDALMKRGRDARPCWGIGVVERTRRSGIRNLPAYFHELYCTVYSKDHNLYEKIDRVDQFIREHVSDMYHIPRPSDQYPWGLDQFYTVLDQARGFIRERGFYAYSTDKHDLVVTNSRHRMIVDNARIADILKVIHVK